MDTPLFIFSGQPVTPLHLLLAAAGAMLLLVVILIIGLARSARLRREEREDAEERQQDLDAKMAALARSSAELTGRMQTVAEVFGTRQADLARLVSERLDAVGHRVGQGLESSSKTTTENLTKLNERLAVIDAAQNRLTDLTQEVIGLKDILANKQARGAFGQGRMEAIIRDALPASAYEFQHTLSNRMRPDCCIRLPGDHRMMVIDAKFPLESFTALKAAAGDETALKLAMARVRGDIGKHIKDIAERYFLPGETQDIAMMFVPSESLYAEINETFEDVVAKAHKARLIIVSPSLLMMAVQVMQAIVRDARVREQAHAIQNEVRLLIGDVGRLHERIGKLGNHFRQVGDDVANSLVSADKVLKRGERIDAMDFTEREAAVLPAAFGKAAE
ncbi:DNA recombination protein RmuC [Beijerinckia sp. L45]|uniref:DNA recombination protein RmuC n=1 Tax=Beijerinckia sp. L45 TaxID=1641855 RepID=UPI00131D369A|nr:DNA recombination protein RmuC [Beijerinckia sp. L45]